MALLDLPCEIFIVSNVPIMEDSYPTLLIEVWMSQVVRNLLAGRVPRVKDAKATLDKLCFLKRFSQLGEAVLLVRDRIFSHPSDHILLMSAILELGLPLLLAQTRELSHFYRCRLFFFLLSISPDRDTALVVRYLL